MLLPLIILTSTSFLYAFRGQVARSYDFLPYVKIRPGTNGDGGISYPPAIVVNGTHGHPILNSSLDLERIDLGWSGDLITDWNRSEWQVVAVVENRNSTPAIIAANQGKGHIVYATNQLAPYERLVYNILAWHFDARELGNRSINVSVMIDVPPGQILDDWEKCFNRTEHLRSKENPTMHVNQFELREEDLRHVDVLVLAVRWGDGYYAGDWNWNSHGRDDAIRKFVERGGLLLLPEAGFVDDYIGIPVGKTFIFPPVRSLEEILSIQSNAFAMAGISASAIVGLYTIREGYGRVGRRYNWVAGYLFLATFVWIMVPLFGGLLWLQTAALLTALSANLTALIILAYPPIPGKIEILLTALALCFWCLIDVTLVLTRVLVPPLIQLSDNLVSLTFELFLLVAILPWLLWPLKRLSRLVRRRGLRATTPRTNPSG